MKSAWQAIVAVGAGTMLAMVLAIVSGMSWWGECLLYAEGRAPRWCEAVPIFLILLWTGSIAICVWLTRKGVRL
jgi:hypothetical protein